MSVLAKHKGLVRSGRIIEITEAPEDETELVVGARVWVAGVDDAGNVNVIMDSGRGEWRVFDAEQFEWRELGSASVGGGEL